MIERTPDSALGLAVALDVEHLPCMQACTIVDRGNQISITRCSDYAKVWFAAMGCPLPVGFTANELFDWLAGAQAAVQGWVQCDLETATKRANLGYPTVAVLKEAGHGHIAPCIPSPSTDTSTLYVSAAGARNYNRCTLLTSFGHTAPLFWSHQ